MTWIFANNDESTVSSAINATATTVILASGTGALFPNPNTALGERFKLTHINSTNHADEIVNVTARSGDTLTITRGREGTTAVAWAAGDKVASLLTAEEMTAMSQSLYPRKATFTSNGSFTVPPGVVNLIITAAAGGGAGGSGRDGPINYVCGGGGGGGAGEAITAKHFTVVPGTVIPITIGLAGIHVPPGTAYADPGTATTIGSLVTLRPGSGGASAVPATTTSSVGGIPGAGYPGGEQGSSVSFLNAQLVVTDGGGGQGGGQFFGLGGWPGRSTNDPVSVAGYNCNAQNYGGGGGGAGANWQLATAFTGASGGDGAQGIVILEW